MAPAKPHLGCPARGACSRNCKASTLGWPAEQQGRENQCQHLLEISQASSTTWILFVTLQHAEGAWCCKRKKGLCQLRRPVFPGTQSIDLRQASTWLPYLPGPQKCCKRALCTVLRSIVAAGSLQLQGGRFASQASLGQGCVRK